MLESRASSRRLRFFLRDFRMLDGSVTIADGQSLTSYLGSRKNYFSLQDAVWKGTGERAPFAVLRVDQLLWAVAMEGDVALIHATRVADHHHVELQLEGGLLVRAGLQLGRAQRLGDYLEAAGAFIPLQHAQLLRSGRPAREVNLVLGDVVLNQRAIQAMWEVDAPLPVEETAGGAALESAGAGARRDIDPA